MRVLANTTSHYGLIAKSLHWLVAALIVVQYLLVQAAERAEEVGSELLQIAHLANHKSLGMTVLILALIRFLLRCLMTTPTNENLPRWQQQAAEATHIGFYLLLFAIPVSGWLMSSAAAYSVSWFNVFSFPDLVDPSETLKHQMYILHEWLTRILLLLIALHVAAALKHRWIDHDDVLSRMFAPSWLLFVIVVIGTGSAYLLGASIKGQDKEIEATESAESNTSQMEQNATDAKAVAKIVEASALPAWDINTVSSNLAFSAVQAGASFIGQFEQWDALIKFSPDELEHSGFVVNINLASVNTRDDERDTTVRDTPFFNIERFPRSVFVAHNVRRQPGKYPYVSEGYLTLKGNTLPLSFEFAVETTANVQRLVGYARIDRLAFNVGEGEWLDTTWIGQYVDVNVAVQTN